MPTSRGCSRNARETRPRGRGPHRAASRPPSLLIGRRGPLSSDHPQAPAEGTRAAPGLPTPTTTPRASAVSPALYGIQPRPPSDHSQIRPGGHTGRPWKPTGPQTAPHLLHSTRARGRSQPGCTWRPCTGPAPRLSPPARAPARRRSSCKDSRLGPCLCLPKWHARRRMSQWHGRDYPTKSESSEGSRRTSDSGIGVRRSKRPGKTQRQSWLNRECRKGHRRTLD